MATQQRALSRVVALTLAVGLSVSAQASRAQPPEAIELSSTGCATEGGHIEVRWDGAGITYWKGVFCRSTDCTTFEVLDIQDDGQAIVTVAGNYLDGGEISYKAKVRIDKPAWQPDAMMSMYYDAVMREDIRQIQALFELTEAALARDATDVRCR